MSPRDTDSASTDNNAGSTSNSHNPPLSVPSNFQDAPRRTPSPPSSPPRHRRYPSEVSSSPVTYSPILLGQGSPAGSRPTSGFLMGGASNRPTRSLSQYITTSTQSRQTHLGHRPSRPSLLRATDESAIRRTPSWSQPGNSSDINDSYLDNRLSFKSRDLIQAAVFLTKTRTPSLSYDNPSAVPVAAVPNGPPHNTVNHRHSVAFIDTRSVQSATNSTPTSTLPQTSTSLAPNLQSPVHLPNGELSSPIGDIDPTRISQDTIKRAEICREQLELKFEYIRLLDALPPLHPHNHEAGASASSSRNPAPRLNRVYNPLQAIRNRGTRKRSRMTLDPGPEQWEDTTRVKTWVDTVLYASSKPGFYAHDIVTLPEFAEHTPPRANASLDRTHPFELRLRDWVIRPSELLADQYWLEQGRHKAEIENQVGDRIFPTVERAGLPGSRNGSASSRQTAASSTIGASNPNPEGSHPHRSERPSLDSYIPDNVPSVKSSHNPLTRALVKTRSTITAPFRHESHKSGSSTPVSSTPVRVPGQRHGSDRSYIGASSNSPNPVITSTSSEGWGDPVSPRTQYLGQDQNPAFGSSLTPVQTRASLDETRHSFSFPQLKRSSSHTFRKKSKLNPFNLKSTMFDHPSADSGQSLPQHDEDSSSKADSKHDKSSGWPGSVSRRILAGKDILTGKKKSDESGAERVDGSSPDSSIRSGLPTPRPASSSGNVKLLLDQLPPPLPYPETDSLGQDPASENASSPEFPDSSAIQRSTIAEAEEPDPVFPVSSLAAQKPGRLHKSGRPVVVQSPIPPIPYQVNSKRPPRSTSKPPSSSLSHRKVETQPCGLGWDDRFSLGSDPFRVMTGQEMKRMEALIMSSRIRAQGMMRVMTTPSGKSGSGVIPIVNEAMRTRQMVDDMISHSVTAHSKKANHGDVHQQTHFTPPLPSTINLAKASVYTAPVMASFILQQSLEQITTSSTVLRQQSNLEIESFVEKFNRVRKNAKDRWIPEMNQLLNQLDETDTLRTKFLGDFSVLLDEIDELIRTRRRQFVWVRQLAYSALEWALVSIMWLTWMVVMFVRTVSGVSEFLIRLVRWLFWLS